MGRFQSGQMDQTVTLLVYTFGGSNPPLPTNQNFKTMFKPIIVKLIAVFLFIIGLILTPFIIGIPLIFVASDIKDYANKLEKKFLES